MTELLATLIVTASSAFLFAYWFRYTCLLILSTRTARDYTAEVASANQLGFIEIQSLLRAGGSVDLDRLKDSLDRDYELLTYLLRNSTQAGTREDAVEKRMLEIDYRLMAAWYSLARSFSPAAACRSLDEMSRVVAHFANAMGERAAAAA